MNKSNRSKAVYSLRQRFLPRLARERGMFFSEAQKNQRALLKNNSAYQEQLEELINSIKSGGNNFETASDRLNRVPGVPLASSTPAPGPSRQPDLYDAYTLSPSSSEDIFGDMDPFNQVGNGNIDVVGNGDGKNKAAGGVQAIGGSLSVMGQSPALQILNNPSIPTNSFTIRHSHLLISSNIKSVN